MNSIKCVSQKDFKLLKLILKQSYALPDGTYEITLNFQNEPEAIILYSGDVDTIADVRVGSNGLKAEITLLPPINNGRKLSFDGLFDLLVYDSGIHESRIDTDALNEVYRRYNQGYIVDRAIIATGSLPINGIDGEIKLNFRRPDFIPIEDDHGNVDYRNIYNIVNVTTDDILAYEIPPTDGRPGLTVTNDIIPQIPGKKAELKILKGVAFNRQGLFYYATQDGHVLIHDNKIAVNPIFYVDGDLDLSVGNIKFNGHVHINGDVPGGFLINGKSIRIKGICKDSELIAKEDIIIENGIISSGRHTIRAGRDVITGHAEHAIIYAGNNIIIKNFSLHSKLYSENEIIVEEGEGLINGGDIQAFKSISAKTIGNKRTSPFSLYVGKKYYLEDKLEETIKERDRLEKTIKETDEKIKIINRKSPDSKKDPKMKQILTARRLITIKLEKLTQKTEALIKECIYKTPIIKVSGKIYEGIKLIFFGTEYIVKNEGENIKFYFNNDRKQVVTAYYHEDVYKENEQGAG